MFAHTPEAVQISTGPRSLREIDRLNAWKSYNLAKLTELLHRCMDSRYKLVDAQYMDCDPSISGAFRTTFLSKEHFGMRDEHPDAEWIRPTIRDYADFPWEAVWHSSESLFRNDAGPRVLRIHLVSSRLTLFAKTQEEGHPDIQDCCQH